MSNGRSAKPQIPQSPEERIDDLEKRFERILERIGAYDKIVDAHQKLTKRLGEIHELLESALKGNDARQAQLDVLKADFSKESAQRHVSDELLEISDRRIETYFDNHIERIDKLILQLNKSHSKLSDTLKSLDSKFANKKELNDFQETVAQEFTQKLQVTQEIVNQIKSVKQDIDAVKTSNSRVSEAIKDHARGIDELNQLSQKKSAETKSMLAASEKSQMSLFQQKIDEVAYLVKLTKQELIGSPSSIESTKSQLLDEMKAMRIDSSTATIKSNNNEAQLKIFEKKMENLAAQIKANALK
jgi:chromosome segregation ATPase